ncbi:hypothetical protein BU14_0285s0031 [Porphyra umbilicalis]|uniref:Methyltransferase FkbM domain-containing protein n=1 Tax=Porphyra umbilicalis TaxID=2786 RepID=A0A1X6P1M6_PORUM|nr:hypothetical protein BU14_0285s0031 [Porphyra umbilicalis]|eukprot:OSX74543.1 hypothetical protein BU14_0285s0031 [Porphyra umbilicalis]
MAFHATRDDFGCFACLDGRKAEVSARPVEVYTVDGLLDAHVPPRVPVALLKTDTQGHEAHVLDGAAAALRAARVRAVLVEFDPRLLGRRATGLRVLATLVGARFWCVHLAFAPAGGGALWGGGAPVTAATAEAFYDWVVAQGGYTDLLCVHQSVGG